LVFYITLPTLMMHGQTQIKVIRITFTSEAILRQLKLSENNCTLHSYLHTGW